MLSVPSPSLSSGAVPPPGFAQKQPLHLIYALRYNGELISPSIKEVPVPTKPAGYEYGAVSADATPVLFVGAIAVVALAAFIPAFLSAGESAKKQQEGFEQSNKIGYNEFAIKNRQNKSTPAVGQKKNAAPGKAPSSTQSKTSKK